MTSFKPSDTSLVCSSCGGPVSERQAHPYPVLMQILFAVSFVAFLVFFDKLRVRPAALWAWSGIQAVLGVLLVRGRLRARKRVLRCIRCGVELR